MRPMLPTEEAPCRYPEATTEMSGSSSTVFSSPTDTWIARLSTEHPNVLAAFDVLAVPETAIRYDADGASVMIVGANNRVKRVPVTTGARGGGLVALVKGPPVGSLVIENAAAFLLDGDQVRPVMGAAK